MSAIYNRILITIVMITAGFTLRNLGLIKREDSRVVSALVMNLTLPCVVIKSMNGTSFDSRLIFIIFLSVVVNGIYVAAAMLYSKNGGAENRLVSVYSIATFNIGNYIIPILSGIISAEAMTCVLMFNYPVAALFTYGVLPICADTGKDIDAKTQFRNAVKMLRKNTVLIVCCIMVILSLVHISLPQPVITAASAIGEANTMLAMTSIGLLLEPTFDAASLKSMAGMLTARTVISLVCTLGILAIPFLPMESRASLAFICFAPASSVNPVLAVKSGYTGPRVAMANTVWLLMSVLFLSLLARLLF